MIEELGYRHVARHRAPACLHLLRIDAPRSLCIVFLSWAEYYSGALLMARAGLMEENFTT